jgi:ribosomal protein S18 acetylase RimI-like enzyme
MNTSQIVPMSKHHAATAAELHRRGIDAGFLSSLGQSFLKQLYLAVPRCRVGFCYVWEEPDCAVLGFIACAESTRALYKQALRRRGFWMALPLMRYMVRPSILRRMWHTWRYPSEVGDDLPAAEVLSIAVSGNARGKGVGKALMQAALAEFARRGIDKVKVAVWAGNDTANTFYRRCGFNLTLTRKHHGLPMNIYTIAVSALD